MRAIDQAFEVWATRGEDIMGRPIDRKQARVVFEIYDRPMKPVAPEEYAEEYVEMLPYYGFQAETWGDLNSYPPRAFKTAATDARGKQLYMRAPLVWKSCAPAQRILNWFYWLLRR